MSFRTFWRRPRPDVKALAAELRRKLGGHPAFDEVLRDVDAAAAGQCADIVEVRLTIQGMIKRVDACLTGGLTLDELADVLRATQRKYDGK